MSFEIEKGIPAPLRSIRGTRFRFPWEDMLVGDSFAVPCADKQTYHKIASAIQHRNKKFPETGFISKKDKAASTMRVWRVK